MINKISKPGVIFLALFAALAATLCDAIHVYTKALSYPDPLYWQQAGWVFPGFFLAFLLMAISYIVLSKQLHHVIRSKVSRSRGSYPVFVDALILFMIIYMLSGFGNTDPIMLCIIFYISFIIRWCFAYEKVWLLILAILLAVGGMFVEGLLSHFGLVKYRHADIFYVPYWLGGVYLHGAFALREGMRVFVYK